MNILRILVVAIATFLFCSHSSYSQSTLYKASVVFKDNPSEREIKYYMDILLKKYNYPQNDIYYNKLASALIAKRPNK